MKPLPETELNPAISTACGMVAKAKEELANALAEAQRACEHRFVSEAPWSTSNPATRICNHCRLIERGTHWSGGKVWSKEGHEPSDLGNVEGRLVLPITISKLWEMRISP